MKFNFDRKTGNYVVYDGVTLLGTIFFNSTTREAYYFTSDGNVNGVNSSQLQKILRKVKALDKLYNSTSD